MEDLVFLVLGLLLIAAGVFHRRNLFRAYEGDRKRYTGTTPMKIIHIEESTMTTWEEQEDGTRQERYSTFRTPTYEYTVDGKTYQYVSRQDTCHSVGACVTGYYDPNNPKLIREDPVRPPYFAGLLFFLMGAAFLFAGGYTIFYGVF